MDNFKTQRIWRKMMVTGMLTFVLLTAAACGSGDGADSSGTPDVDASTSGQEPGYSQGEPGGASASEVRPPEAGTARAHFTMSYGEEMDGTLNFSFDFPEAWTVEPDAYIGMVYNGDVWAAQVEMPPKRTQQAFSDTNELWGEAISSKDLTAAGYPAKSYAIESGAEGSDLKKTQHLYYIKVGSMDDAYVFIFFNPDISSELTEAGLEKIISSFMVTGA
ncbi:MAG: hypothetical protein LBV27_02100 [Oscillospiraceae bacterium]|nr:hypothetical protein [Oscillospiraceae bacterium]